MKKIILPKNSVSLTETQIKNIEGGIQSNDAFSNMLIMFMNRIVTSIGYAIFDPVDAVNLRLRSMYSPYASSSLPLDAVIEVAEDISNDAV